MSLGLSVDIFRIKNIPSSLLPLPLGDVLLSHANLRQLIQEVRPTPVSTVPRVIPIGVEHDEQHIVNLSGSRELDDGASKRVHTFCRRRHQEAKFFTHGFHRRGIRGRRTGERGREISGGGRRRRRGLLIWWILSLSLSLSRRRTLSQLLSAANGVVPLRLFLSSQSNPQLESL